jgi:nodulation protein F
MVSMEQEILDTTIELIAEKAGLDPKTVSYETEIAVLDIKSLDLTEIIFDLEDKYDIEIEFSTAKAWERLKTISDVARTVAELVESRK